MAATIVATSPIIRLASSDGEGSVVWLGLLGLLLPLLAPVGSSVGGLVDLPSSRDENVQYMYGGCGWVGHHLYTYTYVDKMDMYI